MESKLQKITENFTIIPISANCREKMKRYAKYANGSEVYGLLLSSKEENDGIVRNILLANNQVASGASAGIYGEAVGQAKAEIENMGYNSIGFWHSHGTFNAFHSSTDDGNLENLLLSFAGDNEEKTYTKNGNSRIVDHEKSRLIYDFGNYGICVTLKKNSLSYRSDYVGSDYLKIIGQPDIKPIMVLTEDFRLLIKDNDSIITLKDPIRIETEIPRKNDFKTIGVAYSIVVNRNGEEYAQLAHTNWCSMCEKDDIIINKNAKLKEVEVENDIEINEKEMISELKKRVKKWGFGW
ncbi:MAG: Mov34/MPN/PAD-1 family protein [Candidatus Pacearchaeota archaeon]